MVIWCHSISHIHSSNCKLAANAHVHGTDTGRGYHAHAHGSDHGPPFDFHGSDRGPPFDFHGSDRGPPFDFHGSDRGPPFDFHGSDRGPPFDFHGSDRGPPFDFHGSDHGPPFYCHGSDHGPRVYGHANHDSETWLSPKQGWGCHNLHRTVVEIGEWHQVPATQDMPRQPPPKALCFTDDFRHLTKIILCNQAFNSKSSVATEDKAQKPPQCVESISPKTFTKCTVRYSMQKAQKMTSLSSRQQRNVQTLHLKMDHGGILASIWKVTWPTPAFCAAWIACRKAAAWCSCLLTSGRDHSFGWTVHSPVKRWTNSAGFAQETTMWAVVKMSDDPIHHTWRSWMATTSLAQWPAKRCSIPMTSVVGNLLNVTGQFLPRSPRYNCPPSSGCHLSKALIDSGRSLSHQRLSRSHLMEKHMTHGLHGTARVAIVALVVCRTITPKRPYGFSVCLVLLQPWQNIPNCIAGTLEALVLRVFNLFSKRDESLHLADSMLIHASEERARVHKIKKKRKLQKNKKVSMEISV